MEDSTLATCAVCSRPILAAADVARVGQLDVHLDCYPPHQHAESKRRRGHAVCPLCQIPLVAGDRVIYGRQQLVHAQCYDRARAGDVLAQFLSARRGQPFCHTCLAKHLALPLNRVRQALWALRATTGFTVRPDRCAACGAPRVTIAAIEGVATEDDKAS